MEIKQLINKMTENKLAVAAALAVAGILLLLVSFKTGGKPAETTPDINDREYVAELEKRVGQMVSQISGVGKSNVMISLASSAESVYVKENKKILDSGKEQNKSESEDSVITMSDSSGNQYALVTKKLTPKVSGVTVVCDGGNNPSVQAAVIRAVSTVLDIGANKVCVIA